jgi:hypothetical protein
MYARLQEKIRLDKIRKKKQDERQIHFIILQNEYSKTSEYDDILSLSLSDLQDKLFKRELTAEKVMKAYVTKALEVQEEFNCITEFIPGFMVSDSYTSVIRNCIDLAK